MTTRSLAARTLALISAGALTAAAQTPAVHLIKAPDAATPPAFGAVAAVRQLPSGALLVNDITRRQLSLIDPAFTAIKIVADSTDGAANSYGTRPGGIIPYVGDSTLFVDPAGLSMFVIDPSGAIARVASVPRSQDAPFIGSNVIGSPGLDAAGRLVYRGAPARRLPTVTPGSKAITLPDPPDSAAIVRVDLATRKLDTAAFYKIPRVKMHVEQTERGFSATSEINPLPTVDDWAVLADGSIAIVRGQDYHVDVVGPDGTLTSGAKIPFDWQRLTDDDKTAVIDSAKAAIERARATAVSTTSGGRGDGPVGAGSPGMVVMSFRGSGDGGAPRVSIGGDLPPLQFVSAADLPDYRPAFGQGGVRADGDGNLWVRTSAVREGQAGTIYDVIDRRGALIDRVQLQPGRTIVGFGKGGIVYMAAHDERGTWLERTKR